MCHYLGGGLHGRQKRVKAQSESSKSVVNSVLISREKPVFPGFLEIIRVVIAKFLESTTVQVLTITLCVFAIVALLLRLRLHQTMLSVVTTSYASIDETRAHIEGQIWLPDLRQRDVENYCAGFVYTDESKTTLDHISARYELQGGCVLRFLADYDRTIDLIIDDSNDLQFLECDNRCIYYRQDSSSRTDFYFAYFSENDIYYELMLSVPIGTLSSDDAMGMLFRIASP